MREAGAFLQYIPWLTIEIIKANMHVFKLAMTRKGYDEVAPRIVTIKTKLKTDFAKFVFANSITLDPGTITMLIRGDVFHVHTMSQFLRMICWRVRSREKLPKFLSPMFSNLGEGKNEGVVCHHYGSISARAYGSCPLQNRGGSDRV